MPYIGRRTLLSNSVYVATGFGGWGMTNGTVAGLLLRDLILGRDNPWADVYDPNRVTLAGLPAFVKQTATVARHFVVDRLKEQKQVSLAPGEGKILDTEQGTVAVYKAEDGKLTALSPLCTHMGCMVQWNPAERSWDCPCHGSRFATDGAVLHGPAIDGLATREAAVD